MSREVPSLAKGLEVDELPDRVKRHMHFTVLGLSENRGINHEFVSDEHEVAASKVFETAQWRKQRMARLSPFLYARMQSWCYRVLGVFALVWVLIGCAAKVHDMWRDPEFTANRLQAGSLAIGGVGTAIGASNQDGLSELLDSVVCLSLRKELPNLRIADPGLTRLKLGVNLRQKLLTSYVRMNTIGEADVATMRNGFADSPTYLLFGNLVQNTIVRKSITVNSGQRDQHDVENNERHMRFLFAVYDSRDGRQVWRCDISAVRPTETGEEDPTANYPDLSNPVGFLLDQLVHGTNQTSSPIGSSTGRVMRVIFERLAHGLVAEK